MAIKIKIVSKGSLRDKGPLTIGKHDFCNNIWVYVIGLY